MQGRTTDEDNLSKWNSHPKAKYRGMSAVPNRV